MLEINGEFPAGMFTAGDWFGWVWGWVLLSPGRGRHTTRHVSLLQMPGGGLLADTPGFGNPGLESVTTLALQACFPGGPCMRLPSRLDKHVDAGMYADGRTDSTDGLTISAIRRSMFTQVGTDWERYEHYQLLWDEVEAIETTFRRNFAKDEREGNVSKYELLGIMVVSISETGYFSRKIPRMLFTLLSTDIIMQ
eukprot:gene5242-6375_t